MRDLRVGDRVIAREGTITRIGGVSVGGKYGKVVMTDDVAVGVIFVDDVRLPYSCRNIMRSVNAGDLTRIPKHRSDEPLVGWKIIVKDMSRNQNYAYRTTMNPKHRAEGEAN